MPYGIDVTGNWDCKKASHLASEATARWSIWLQDVLQCPVLQEMESVRDRQLGKARLRPTELTQ